MKKTIGILLLAVILVFSLTSCSGGGGGSSGISGVINKITGKSNITYSFANSNFGFKTNNANEEHFKFTSSTAVTYIHGVSPAVTRTGTYTDVSTKSGTLTITFADGQTPATISRAYEFTDDGNKVTGVKLDGLAFTKY
ncbi:MAG: hypothetical protein IKZ86_12315 [Spirochaetaceae bacterium]|nr:hypothetical protein [Spirochaetaceae bacterium]